MPINAENPIDIIIEKPVIKILVPVSICIKSEPKIPIITPINPPNKDNNNDKFLKDLKDFRNNL